MLRNREGAGQLHENTAHVECGCILGGLLDLFILGRYFYYVTGLYALSFIQIVG